MAMVFADQQNRDLHQGNVLFEEIDNDGEKIIVARLVDWGRIRWRLTTADKAPADEIKKFVSEYLAGYIQTYANQN